MAWDLFHIQYMYGTNSPPDFRTLKPFWRVSNAVKGSLGFFRLHDSESQHAKQLTKLHQNQNLNNFYTWWDNSFASSPSPTLHPPHPYTLIRHGTTSTHFVARLYHCTPCCSFGGYIRGGRLDFKRNTEQLPKASCSSGPIYQVLPIFPSHQLGCTGAFYHVRLQLEPFLYR